MELLFVYLEKYGSIIEKTFNFNPRYKFELFDDNGEKIIRLYEDPDWLNIFNDVDQRISNVTAIVGENGTGKTTLFRFLMDFYKTQGFEHINVQERKKQLKNNKYVVIFLAMTEGEPERFVIYTNEDIKIDPKIEQQFKINSSDHGIIRQQKCIYYTEAFNALSYAQYMREAPDNIVSNLSIEGRIVSAIKSAEGDDKGLSGNPIETFLHWETACQLKAFEAARIPFKISGISIKPIVPDSMEYMAFMSLNDSNKDKDKDRLPELKKRISEFYDGLDLCNYNKGNVLLRAVIASLIQFMMLSFYVKNPDRDEHIQEIDKIIDKWEDLLRGWKRNVSISNIVEFVRCVYGKETIWAKNSEPIFSRFEKTLKIFSKYNVKFNKYTSTFYINLSKNGNAGYLMNWFKCYDESSHHGTCPYLSFEWGMSTGERAYFNFFAYLYSVYEKMEYKKDILLMLDEADLYLHPKWQQGGVKRMIDTVLKCFHHGDSKIQIIFATHSPLFLSDVPSRHVIFLNNGQEVTEHKECFASNIYNLYKDAFFLNKDEIWVRGSFSDHFVRKIEEKLTDWENDVSRITEEDLQEIKRRISLIGEELLKTLLLKRWTKLYKLFYGTEKEKLSPEARLVLNEFSSLKDEEKEKIRKKIESL